MKSSPPLPESQYKLNFSSLLNQAKSNLNLSSLFSVNLCLTSPLLDTPNKIYAIFLLSQSISKLTLPYTQVYHLIYKCLKYLTTQNIVEPTILMNCFLKGSNFIEQTDISFEFYLKKLVLVLARKHNINLKEKIIDNINECECQLDSNIQKQKVYLSSFNLFKEMNLVKNVIETALKGNNNNNEEDDSDYYIMSISSLKRALPFINEYLTYEHKSKEELGLFIEKAFDYNVIKYLFYKDKYPYNIYAKPRNIEENEIVFPLFLDNSQLIKHKHSLINNNEKERENLFLKRDIKLNEDFCLLNQEQIDIIEKIFIIKKKIIRKKKEIHYKDIKCFVVSENECLNRKFHIQISQYKTVKQFKQKILECTGNCTTNNEDNDKYVIDFYSLNKNQSEILNQIALLNKFNVDIFYSKDITQLHYDDNTAMTNFNANDDSIVIIDIYTSSSKPHVQPIQKNVCMTCNKDIDPQSQYQCEVCCYGLYCCLECSEKRNANNSMNIHMQFHKVMSYFYIKDTSIEEIASIELQPYKNLHGLFNLGSTCFLNSSIQCLFYTADLTKYFLMNFHYKDINLSNKLGTKGELATKYKELLVDIVQHPHLQAVNPIEFVKSIYRKISAFIPGEQNDAHEFISIFLDNLHEDLNRISNKPYLELTEQKEGESDDEASVRFWKFHKQREDSVIVDLFYGQYKSTITCLDCSFKNTTYEPFSSIGLSIPDKLGILQIKYIEMVDDVIPIINEYTTSVYPNTVIKALKDHIRSELRKYELQLEAVVLNKKKMICDIVDDNIKIYSYVKNGFEIYMYNKSHIKGNRFVFVYPMYFSEHRSFSKNKLKKMFIAYPLMIGVNTASKQIVSNIMNVLSKIYDNNISIHALYLFNNKLYFLEKEKPIEIIKDKHKSAIQQSKYLLLNDNQQKELINRLNKSHPTVVFAEIKDSKNIFTLEKYPNVDQRYIPVKKNTDFIKMNPSTLTIQNTFDFFQCEEKLEESNSWYCSKCKKHQEAYKKLDIYKPSKYLIVQFKRFQIKSNNMIMSFFSNKKISTCIDYDTDTLDLRKYVIGPERDKAVYSLYGVVEHFGSLRFGHYTALCKSENGKWIRFNDEKCKEVDKAVVKEAYLLFYKMKENK